MSKSQVSVSKIILGNEDIYLKITWDTLALQMWIFENKNTWYGTMTPQDFQDLSVESMDPVHEYYDNFKLGVAMSDPRYELDIRRINEDNIELIVKQKHERALSTYGVVKLHKDIQSSKNDLLDYMVYRIKDFTADTAKLEDKNRSLMSELDYAKNMWLEEAKLKEKMEKELYSKFVELLNTKKQYIQALESNNKVQNNT